MAFSTQRSRVADELFQGIRHGRYPGGSRLPSERQLAVEFEVSRPVVREALGMLSSLGVVEIQVGRGAFVTEKDVAEQSQQVQRSLTDLDLVRENVECGALLLLRRRGPSDEAKDVVRSALAHLENAVRARQELSDADHALHRSLVQATGSPSLLRVWDEHTDEIDRIVQIDPKGHVMTEDDLERHRVIAGGVVGEDVDAAIETCHALHEEYRDFLQRLLT
ncbi:hypothetical protein GCM10028801_08280 [Nocardioides maradonensis]